MFPSLPSYSPLFLLGLLLFFLLNHSSPAAAADPLYQNCGTADNYTINSAYASNLKRLLAFLDINTSLSGGFSSLTVGQSPNLIYGLSLCRGDTNDTFCRSCLDSAIQDAPYLCRYTKSAIIWYDYCLLHYSNERFLSTVDLSNDIMLYSTLNITNPSRFDKLVDVLMNEIADWAAYNSTKMFATGEMMNSTNPPSPTIYGLAQCTRDLSTVQCRECLSGLLDPRFTESQGKQGARALGGSCNYRFEIYSFYKGAPMVRLTSPLETAPAPAAQAPPLANSVGIQG